MRKNTSGFTIVELLIVIVVIGILATVTVVAYNGIQARATTALLTSNLTNASKQLKLFHIDNSAYPTTIDCGQPDSTTNKCIKTGSDITYQYSVTNTSPQLFCITATKGLNNYNISQNGTAMGGPCPKLYFDAGNIASYTGSGSTWIDLSGNNNSGSLINGVGFSTDGGGSLNFDGVDDRITVQNVINQTPTNQEWTVDAAVKFVASASSNTQSLININSGVNLVQGSSNKLLLYLNSGAHDYYDYGNYNLKDGSWHIISFIFQNSTGKKEIYVDGKDVSTTGPNFTSTPSGIPVTLTIGTLLAGKIGDLRIYDKALSTSEVLQNFNTLKGRYGL